MKVLASTKTWSGDYKQFLTGAAERKFSACLYPFAQTQLIVNNEVPVEYHEALQEGVDRLIIAEEYADEALTFFGLKRKDLGDAYLYSICELVELYLAEDYDYLCHFASDTLLINPYNWITPSIELMEKDSSIITTAPNSEDSIAYGLKNQFFSDQAYLLKVSEWRKHGAFSFLFPDLPEYPSRMSDALFERRAGRFLHNNGKYRQLIKECWYAHKAW